MTINSDLSSYLNKDYLSLIFTRHGEIGGKDPIPEGQPNNLMVKPHTPRGLQQANLSAQRLNPIALNHLYCSNTVRAYQTAAAISALKPDVSMDVISDTAITIISLSATLGPGFSLVNSIRHLPPPMITVFNVKD